MLGVWGRPGERVFPGPSVKCGCGGVLLSHVLSGIVPSPCQGLASGFGMGPGVSPGPWPPQNLELCGWRVGNRIVDASVIGCWCPCCVSCRHDDAAGGFLACHGGVGCLRPLVPVGSTPHGASTSGLSTTCSLWGLTHPRKGGARNPYLGAGFPLRCFQRLSLPNVANQPCRWRDNWHTRGSSTQVLSYYGQASSGFQRAQRIETKLSHDVLNPARVPL